VGEVGTLVNSDVKMEGYGGGGEVFKGKQGVRELEGGFAPLFSFGAGFRLALPCVKVYTGQLPSLV